MKAINPLKESKWNYSEILYTLLLEMSRKQLNSSILFNISALTIMPLEHLPVYHLLHTCKIPCLQNDLFVKNLSAHICATNTVASLQHQESTHGQIHQKLDTAHQQQTPGHNHIRETLTTQKTTSKYVFWDQRTVQSPFQSYMRVKHCFYLHI